MSNKESLVVSQSEGQRDKSVGKCAPSSHHKSKHGDSTGPFWPRVWKDICDKKLLPLKILFFIKAGTVFVLYPYLNLHMKTLGLKADEAGVSNALTILTIVGQPLAGVISDKLGNFKVFLAVVTLITPAPALLMLAVPAARETVDLPHNITRFTDCEVDLSSLDSTPTFTFRQIYGEKCDNEKHKNDSQLLEQLTNSLPNIQCGYVCENIHEPRMAYPPLRYLPVQPKIKYAIPNTEKTFITYENMANSLFCWRNPHNNRVGADICELHAEYKGNQSRIQVSRIDLNLFRSDPNDVQTSQFQLVGMDLAQRNITTRCERRELRHKPGCEPKCLTVVPRKYFCSDTQIEVVHNELLTFWTYNVLRVILTLLSSTCWIMFEGAVLAIMKERNGDYGIQRASSYIAAIIAAPASGFLISYFHDFRPAFYLYTVLQLLSAILTMKIGLEFKKPAKQVLGSLWKLLQNVQVVGLLVAVLFSGIAWGFLESFLFWFLETLGGGGLLMGLTITVGGIAGLPFLLINKPIIDKLGHVHVISIGLIFYGIRLVGYAFIKNPWMSLPYEALEAVTSSLAITAANTYGSLLSCKDTVVSIQGIIGALYYSVGRAVGGLIGGYLIKFFGERSAYKMMAAGSVAAGILYSLFNIIHRYYLKRGNSRRMERQPNQILGDSTTNKKLDPLKFDGGYVGPFAVPGVPTKDITPA